MTKKKEEEVEREIEESMNLLSNRAFVNPMNAGEKSLG
jgi:hypothetical protein